MLMSIEKTIPTAYKSECRLRLTLDYSEQESDDDNSEDEKEAEVTATLKKGIKSEADFNNNDYSSGGEMTRDLQKLEETHIKVSCEKGKGDTEEKKPPPQVVRHRLSCKTNIIARI